MRNKINLAIQDMPEHDEITELLSGSSNYIIKIQYIYPKIKFIKSREHKQKPKHRAL